MKRLLLVFCGLLLLSVFGPVPSASAGWWPWHRHSKNSGSSASSAPAPSAKSAKSKPPKAPKAKWSWHHHEKTAPTPNTGSVVTTPGPRSVGRWHKEPGPAGAGAY